VDSCSRARTCAGSAATRGTSRSTRSQGACALAFLACSSIRARLDLLQLSLTLLSSQVPRRRPEPSLSKGTLALAAFLCRFPLVGAAARSSTTALASPADALSRSLVLFWPPRSVGRSTAAPTRRPCASRSRTPRRPSRRTTSARCASSRRPRRGPCRPRSSPRPVGSCRCSRARSSSGRATPGWVSRSRWLSRSISSRAAFSGAARTSASIGAI